jgi:hypothetical protein
MKRALLFTLPVLWACTPAPPAPDVTTWQKDVGPIVQRKCAT